MFDFHMHSKVSFDGRATGLEMAQAAARAGLKEICFTDHLDYEENVQVQNWVFDTEDYNAAYDHLEVPGLTIRLGMEFGMTPYNKHQLKQDLGRRHFDFILGSVHFVDGLDVYWEPYWEGKTVWEAERRFLEETLRCVQVHDDFDVLAHLSFISKSRAHPAPSPLLYDTHREITDEILRLLAQKGKGLELNSSGVDRSGDFLPGIRFFQRFRELGGEIVTIGSDAHAPDRVGQYADRSCRILKDIFGYVCTFTDRQPIFHKL